MSVQKNFKITNGIEVNTNLIFGDTGSNKVGIATTNPLYTLHVNGGIGATNSVVTGISTVNYLTINGRVTAGSSLGAAGQYLVSTGTGVTWGAVPTVRSTDLQTAGVGATTFNTTYTVGLIDVYVNGVKLSADEYSANNGATVILDDACFGGETVEFISYSPFGIGIGGTSIQGITILEEGSPVGSALQVTSINFVGAAVTATGSGIGVTVYVNDSVNPNYWVSTAAGIHTLSNVGVGTTNSAYKLTVSNNTVPTSGLSNAIADFTNSVDGYTQLNIRNSLASANASSDLIATADTGSDTSNFIDLGINNSVFSSGSWSINGALDGYLYTSDGSLSIGIATSNTEKYLSFFVGGVSSANEKVRLTSSGVGIGTTNPTSALTVKGNTSLETLNVSGIATFAGSNVKINSGNSLDFGTGAGDLHIYRQSGGSNDSIIKYDGSYNFKVLSDITTLASSAGSVTWGVFGNNGVELYYSNSKKFETLGAGVTVTGTTFTNDLSVSGVSTFSGNVRVGVDTSSGVILTSPNGTQYRLIVDNSGTLSTVAV